MNREVVFERRGSALMLIGLIGLALVLSSAGGRPSTATPDKAYAQEGVSDPNGPRIAIDTGVTVFVQDIQGLASENAIATNLIVGTKGQVTVQKLPGNPKIGTFRVIRKVDSNRDLWLWRAQVKNKVAGFRRSGEITAFDANFTQIGQWTFTNAWPSKYEMNSDGDTTYEVVTFTYEDMTRAK